MGEPFQANSRSAGPGVVRILGWINLVLSGVGGVVWFPLALVVGFSTDGGHSRFSANLSHAWTAFGISALLCFAIGLATVVKRPPRPVSTARPRLVIGINTVAILLFALACAWLFPLIAHTAHF